MTDEEIESMLVAAEQSWNVPTISRTLVNILRDRSDLTMADMERSFRKMECKLTYLVAWPKHLIPSGMRPVAIDGSVPDYGLWICVNGPDDMLKTLGQFGLTAEQNMKALEKAGIGVCPA